MAITKEKFRNLPIEGLFTFNQSTLKEGQVFRKVADGEYRLAHVGNGGGKVGELYVGEEGTILKLDSLEDLGGIMATSRTITTTAGERFEYEDHVRMAKLVYKRFGSDPDAAAAAWRRMMQNDCDVNGFMVLVGDNRVPTGDMRDLDRLIDKTGIRRLVSHLVLLLNNRGVAARQDTNDSQAELWEHDAKVLEPTLDKFKS